MANVRVSGRGAQGGATQQEVPCYSLLAGVYDRLVGDALFPAVRASFEDCVQEFDLCFDSAADIGCGTGRFLHHLRRFRVPMYGVDRSPQMLAIAARRLEGSGVRLMRQDLRRLRLPARVDLLTCNGDTLNYLLRPTELARALAAFATALSPGGHLVCDFLSGVPEPHSAATRRIELPGLHCNWRCSVDPHRRLTQVEIHGLRRTGRSWQRQAETHVQRWIPRREFTEALARCGFALRGLRRLDGDAQRKRAWIKLVAVRR